MSLELRPKPLSAAGFAAYGDVIATDVVRGPQDKFDINNGFTTRHNALAQVTTDASAILSIFQGRVRPLQIAMLECHPKGSQAFVPLGGRPWLVVVADRPEMAACQAFLCRGDQGVNYHAGIWHHPLLVLDQPQDFLVVDRHGPGTNLEETFFDKDLRITVD